MKKVAALLVLVLASVALVACGSSSSSTEAESSGGESASGAEKPAEESGGGEGSGAIVGIATPAGTELAFTTKEASAPAGQVSIEFENPQALQHDVSIEDSSGKVVAKTELVSEGSSTATANLKPGTYTFFCSVPGHRQAGMEGTLTVK
jgi:plastocyanin